MAMRPDLDDLEEGTCTWALRELQDSEGESSNGSPLKPDRSSEGWGLQKMKEKAFSWILGGGDRLKSGADADPKTSCEPSNLTQKKNISGKLEILEEGGLVANEQDRREDKNGTNDKDKKLTMADQKLNAQTEPMSFQFSDQSSLPPIRRNQEDRADVHEMLVPERPIDDAPNNEDFLAGFIYFHGYLPQYETYRFIRRQGDYLVRKVEDEGKHYIIITVGEKINSDGSDSEEDEKSYGHDDPIRPVNYMVKRNDHGFFIERIMTFDNLEDLLAFYIFYPHKVFPGNCSSLFRLRLRARKQHWEAEHSQRFFLAEIQPSIGLLVTKVAVKALKSDSPNLKALSDELIAEGRLMLDLNHENVLKMIGWMIISQPFMILLEYMPGGSLENFLLDHYSSTTTSQLLNFAFEASKGLQYLDENDIIHRDIAARNCLLNADGKLKLSDFGLSIEGGFYIMEKTEKLPTRYLSPETLSAFVFLIQSDVYTFGILIYEIFTGGSLPYEEFSPVEARKKILAGITNPMKDTQAPKEVQNFVQDRLWPYNPKARADMSEVVTFLGTHLKKSELASSKPESRKNSALPRRRKINRSDVLEDLCPTQEDTAVPQRLRRRQVAPVGVRFATRTRRCRCCERRASRSHFPGDGHRLGVFLFGFVAARKLDLLAHGVVVTCRDVYDAAKPGK
ncbi:unnamed protein product [Caenorhabditis auriculariae]|uniref:non-specific protein-tyrosine kinase n=1 Tax=Caenorhabditis auriculariae TaxID=2777116 RepID=A0A8S1HVG6_9PELO|nr:unnamed protein product [Caenorhabditis auriculariae]